MQPEQIKALNEKNAQHIQAGCKLASSMIDLAYLKPGGLSKDEMEKLKADIMHMVIPPSISNPSAESLQQLIVDLYIEEASQKIMQHLLDRTVTINIRKTDEDLIDFLKSNWNEKNIKFELKEDIIGINSQKEEMLYIPIVLKW